MKKFVLLAFAFATLATGTAFGQAGADNIHTTINGAAGLRTFRASLYCATGCADCGWYSGNNITCDDGNPCTKNVKKGINPANTHTCCQFIHMYCREDGSPTSKEEIQVALDDERAEQEYLSEVFSAFGQRETYWGYMQATNRSPNSGRTQSIDARLDACLNHSNWDPNGTYPSCLTACGDGSKNAHCAADSNNVCNDRCECKFGQAGCNNL